MAGSTGQYWFQYCSTENFGKKKKPKMLIFSFVGRFMGPKSKKSVTSKYIVPDTQNCDKETGGKQSFFVSTMKLYKNNVCLQKT